MDRKMKRAKADEPGQSVRNKLEELESQHHQHHHHHPAVSPSTPLLNRCCCFSLLTGAVLTGIYATVKQSFTIVLCVIRSFDHIPPQLGYCICIISKGLQYCASLMNLESRKKMVSQLTSYYIKCQVLCVVVSLCNVSNDISVPI